MAEESPSRLGPPLLYSSRYEVVLQRPDKLRILSPGDGPATEFYYDGRSMAAFAPKENYIARSDAPPTIDAALDQAFARAQIYYPFMDLLDADPYKNVLNGLRVAFYIGESDSVGGVKTYMVAYANDHAFVQAWIGVDDKLPRRLRAIYRSDPAMLRHEMDIADWKLNAPVPTGTSRCPRLRRRRCPFHSTVRTTARLHRSREQGDNHAEDRDRDRCRTGDRPGTTARRGLYARKSSGWQHLARVWGGHRAHERLRWGAPSTRTAAELSIPMSMVARPRASMALVRSTPTTTAVPPRRNTEKAHTTRPVWRHGLPAAAAGRLRLSSTGHGQLLRRWLLQLRRIQYRGSRCGRCRRRRGRCNRGRVVRDDDHHDDHDLRHRQCLPDASGRLRNAQGGRHHVLPLRQHMVPAELRRERRVLQGGDGALNGNEAGCAVPISSRSRR